MSERSAAISHDYTPVELSAVGKTFALYGSTMRFMERQVAHALRDPGLRCSVAGAKLEAACEMMKSRARAGDLLLVYLEQF